MSRKIFLFIVLSVILSAIPVQGYFPDLSIYSDASTGKHYFNARYYNAVTETASPELPPGFLSPDIIIGNPDSGQSWNRYAYCVGNPIRFVDPDGKAATEAVLTALGSDILLIDPSDVVPWKWVGWGIAIGGAVVIDWFAVEKISEHLDNVQSRSEPIAKAEPRVKEKKRKNM